MPAQIDYIPDWQSRLAALTFEQFKGSVTDAQWVALLAKQFQDLEDSGQSLLTISSIDDSEGVNLDVIGLLVGQKRNGIDDPTYRLYLKARVRARKSSGGYDDIYAVFFLLFGADAFLQLIPYYPAAFEFRVQSPPLTAEQAAVGLQFLTAAKEAGVQAIFKWQENIDSPPVFRMADGVELVAAAGAGDTHLVLWSTIGWSPDGDTIVIDGGLATEETITYTSITNGIRLELGAPLALSHALGALVERVDDPGLGFGDEADPTVGGEFSGDATA